MRKTGLRTLGWLFIVVALLLVGCSDEGNGNDDTIFTGLSGVVIVAIIVFFVLRKRKKS